MTIAIVNWSSSDPTYVAQHSLLDGMTCLNHCLHVLSGLNHLVGLDLVVFLFFSAGIIGTITLAPVVVLRTGCQAQYLIIWCCAAGERISIRARRSCSCFCCSHRHCCCSCCCPCSCSVPILLLLLLLPLLVFLLLTVLLSFLLMLLILLLLMLLQMLVFCFCLTGSAVV